MRPTHTRARAGTRVQVRVRACVPTHASTWVRLRVDMRYVRRQPPQVVHLGSRYAHSLSDPVCVRSQVSHIVVHCQRCLRNEIN